MIVKHWLRKAPAAVSVNCTTPTGEKVVHIDRKGARCWHEAEMTIAALGATRIEACDAKGNVLRVVDLDPAEGAEDAEERDELPVAELSKFGRDLTQMSRLLGQAYKDGSNATKDAYATSFQYMTTLVESVMKRLDGLERAWVRNLNLHTRFNAQQQEAEDHPLAPLIAGVIQHMTANGLAPGATNGATEPPEPPDA